MAGATMPKTRFLIPTSAAAWVQARECDRLASITTLPNIQTRFLRLRELVDYRRDGAAVD